jgi:hypothetical protein
VGKTIFLFLVGLLLPVSAFAQATGNAFPTPNGQVAPGYMILVPAGPIVNGQPVAAPPSSVNGLPVDCVTCSPSAPIGASSNPVNGTIAVTNTFQTLISFNAGRKSCTFQNQGTHTMYFSVASSPTLANSIQVQPGGLYQCASASNVVITDLVYVTGTAGDAFAGEWQ